MNTNKFIILVIIIGLVAMIDSNAISTELYYPIEGQVVVSYRRLKGKELINYIRMQKIMRIIWLIVIFVVGVFWRRFIGDGTLPTGTIFVIAGIGEMLFENDLIKAKDNGAEIVLEYKRPYRIAIKKEPKEMDAEIIRMCKIKEIDGGKYIVQAEISKIFGVSRQRINHRWMYYQKYGLEELLTRDKKQGEIITELTSKVRKRITELVVDKWWIRLREISERLKEEGLTEHRLALTSIYHAIENMDGLLVQKLMRRMIKRGQAGKQLNEEYLIERLLELTKNLFRILESSPNAQINKLKNEHVDIKQLQERCRQDRERRGPYKRDIRTTRVNLERDLLRKEKRLEEIIRTGEVDSDRCPDCGEKLVSHKEKRSRKYTNGKGEKVNDTAERKYCCNSECRTKSFTVLPEGLESWARYDVRVKGKGLKLLFHVRGSSQRSSDYLGDEDRIKVSAATLLNWIIKGSTELVNLNYFFPPVWSGKMCVDEKWVKLLKRWIYVYKAVDALTGEILHADVFLKLDKVTAKTFLYQIKCLGYEPEVVITDLTSNYDEPLKEVFPSVKHHKCVLHAEMAAEELLRKYFPVRDRKKDKPEKEKNEILREELRKLVRYLFESKTSRQLKRRYRKFLENEVKYPDCAKPMFEMVKKYFPIFLECLKDVGIPRTNNTVERAIGDFASKYQNTKGFTAFDSARSFVRIHLIYSKFRKFAGGRFKGYNHLELQGHSPNINWIEFITGTTYPDRSDKSSNRAPPCQNATPSPTNRVFPYAGLAHTVSNNKPLTILDLPH